MTDAPHPDRWIGYCPPNPIARVDERRQPQQTPAHDLGSGCDAIRAERDRARDLAARLEAELAEVRRLVNEWNASHECSPELWERTFGYWLVGGA